VKPFPVHPQPQMEKERKSEGERSQSPRVLLRAGGFPVSVFLSGGALLGLYSEGSGEEGRTKATR